MSNQSSKQNAQSKGGTKGKGPVAAPQPTKGGPFQRPTAPATHFKIGFRGIVGKVNHHVPETKVAVIPWGTHKQKSLTVYACGTTGGLSARKGKRRRSTMLAKGFTSSGKAVDL